MLRRLQLLVPLLLAFGLLTLAQQSKKSPEKLQFKTKQGNVTFDHAAHVKHAKNECKTCHPSQWPESATAPLNYKAGIHKTAEAKHISCGFCHHPGGGAFESKGNCTKCHVKAAAK